MHVAPSSLPELRMRPGDIAVRDRIILDILMTPCPDGPAACAEQAVRKSGFARMRSCSGTSMRLGYGNCGPHSCSTGRASQPFQGQLCCELCSEGGVDVSGDLAHHWKRCFEQRFGLFDISKEQAPVLEPAAQLSSSDGDNPPNHA